jgi:hypothetical protein
MKIVTTALTLSTLLIFASIVAASANAAPEWLADGVAIGESKADTGESKGQEILLEFKSALINFAVDCKVVMEGTTGPGAAGTITKSNTAPAECTLLEGIGPLQEVAFLKLPWKTELTLVMEGVNLYRDLVLSGGTGEPGWLVKLNGVDFVCEWEAAKELFAEATNVAEGVDYVFHGNEAPTAKCSSMGTGKIDGLILFELGGGKILSVSG